MSKLQLFKQLCKTDYEFVLLIVKLSCTASEHCSTNLN